MGKIDIKCVMDWFILIVIKFGVGKNVMFKYCWVNEFYIGCYVGIIGSVLIVLELQFKVYFMIDIGFGGGIGFLLVVDKEQMFVFMWGSLLMFMQLEVNFVNQFNNVFGSYNGNQEDINVGYVMMENKFGKWQFVFGICFEVINICFKVLGQVLDNQNFYVFFDVVNGNWELFVLFM